MSDSHDYHDETKSTASGFETGRRDFLKGIGLGAALGVSGLAFADSQGGMDGLQVVDDPIGDYPYRDWEDLYREQWDWDSTARSTHSVNCTGSCSWEVFVRNGQVWREEQAGDYPQFDESLPDPNPRGCQKGACYSDYVNADQRVLHPLRRTGERGEGKWQRISWDEALTEIAEEVVDTVQDEEYDGISGFTPIPAMSPVSFASGSRLINLLGGVSHSFYDWYSDLPPGQPITWGTQTDNAESADWYNADYIIAWGSNVNVTRIPDAKYFLEAAYNGTKRVGVFTDYSQTAIHCDDWLSPEPGSDTALALGMARVIVEEDLYDEAHLKEQTDMPLLVRTDTGKFLRASEVPGLGADVDRPEKVFVMQDADGDLQVAPASLGDRDGQHDASASIELDFDPQLDVDRTVDTVGDGRERAPVRTVWNNLQDELANYTPEYVNEVTSVGRETHQQIAREFAAVERAKIIHGKGVNDWYHNDLGNRAIQLLVTLTGNLGRQGTGLDHYVGQEKIWTFHGWQILSFPTGSVRGVPTTLWTYYHCDVLDNADPDTAERVQEAIDRDWMPVYPEERDDGSRPDPSVLFMWRGNYFNQAKGNVAVEEQLWPKLDLVVDINFRMDSSALYSDIVLPTASHYEKHDLSMTDMHSYVHPFTPAVEPLGESKTDWQIYRELAAKIQEVAEERGVDPIQDRKFDREIDLQSVHDDYVRDWETDEAGALAEDKAAAEFILDHSEESNPEGTDERITFDGIDDQPKRLLEAGDHWTSDIEEGEAYTPWQNYVQDKEPWPTFSGRQQYYIDHDWFLDLGEELPTHKDSPTLQDKADYPLRYNTPHGRWSIHSTWRDSEKMLRLQRGEPTVYLNPEDMAERDIEDGDTVRIYNDLGEVEIMAKRYPSSEPGTARMYFAWERFQFPDRNNFNSLVPLYMKPTQLVQYPEDTGEHLHFFPNYWGPTGVNSDVRVEVEKIADTGETVSEAETESEARVEPADGAGSAPAEPPGDLADPQEGDD